VRNWNKQPRVIHQEREGTVNGTRGQKSRKQISRTRGIDTATPRKRYGEPEIEILYCKPEEMKKQKQDKRKEVV
jgi:hypothetical protein